MSEPNTSMIQTSAAPIAPTNLSLSQSQPPAPQQPCIRTRIQNGLTKKKKKIFLLMPTDVISPLPLSHVQAAKDLNWNPTMHEEYGSIIDRGTWTIVPRPPNVNVVRSMWTF